MVFFRTTLLLSLISTLLAFDLRHSASVVDKDVDAVNQTTYQREMYTDGDSSFENYLEVNEIPVRYDETQLWRIYNVRRGLPVALYSKRSVTDTLEAIYGGVVWKETAKFLDISISKNYLKEAQSFLTQHNISSEVLHTNIQELMDMEQVQGLQTTQSELNGRAKRSTSSGINWQAYHDLKVIYDYMQEISVKFPNITQLYNIGKTFGGRDLKVLRISENPKKYKKIWIDGGIHAREWISPATVTYIIHQLMSKWSEQPAYIKKKTWYIMPVMNPDGYVYSRKVNRLWRKNRAPSKRSNCVGVDLNRNFNIGWASGGSSNNPCSEIYHGTSAASELETKAVVRFLTKHKQNLKAYLTFHSYGQLIVYPWAYKEAKVKDFADLQRVGNTAVQRIKKKTNATYIAAPTHTVLGIASGGSDDWTRSVLEAKYVYTIELRDRGTHGFVLPPKLIKITALEGYILVKTVAQVSS